MNTLPNTSLSFEDFNIAIKKAANDTLLEEVTEDQGWFMHSKHLLTLLFETRSTLLNQVCQL